MGKERKRDRWQPGTEAEERAAASSSSEDSTSSEESLSSGSVTIRALQQRRLGGMGFRA